MQSYAQRPACGAGQCNARQTFRVFLSRRRFSFEIPFCVFALRADDVVYSARLESAARRAGLRTPISYPSSSLQLHALACHRHRLTTSHDTHGNGMLPGVKYTERRETDTQTQREERHPHPEGRHTGWRMSG
eukprot:scaffold20225_cov121-Isochrysis_galbana.AAC.7